ncbi:MAG: DUF58 domain-containing protein [Myxococcota bacterium]
MAQGSPQSDALAAIVPAELRELLRSRTLTLSRPIWGRRHGRHASARAGLGLDFRDHRAYVPGDDPRMLDWRAVARRERLVLRQTESEDELRLTLVVDDGKGMAYGQGDTAKRRFAHAVAGGLSWLAHRQGDAIAAALGRNDEVDQALLRPSGGRERLSALAHHLSHDGPAGRCPWGPLMDTVAPRLSRRSLLVVISDFLDLRHDAQGDADAAEDKLLRGLSHLRAKRHDVVLVQVLHRDELTFPWADRRMLKFIDLRGLVPTLEGPGRSLRDGYLERMNAHLQRQVQRCEAEGIVLHRMVTDQPLPSAFVELLGRLSGAPGALDATREAEAGPP